MDRPRRVAPGPDEETLARPLPAAWTVRQARDVYLDENGFSLADYGAATVTVKAFGIPFVLPNGANRKWAIPRHDLHHVATGYGSDLIGEGEIGAWELGAGCRRPVTYVLNLVAASLGVLLAPRRMLRAFRHGLAQRTLYRHPYDDALLDADVAALRAHLGIPREGLATHPRKLHEDAWKAYLAARARRSSS